MNVQKLAALVAAIELGSFSRAAEKLGYTQSGLTHMMNSLEDELGFPLLCRGYFGVRPTEEGERLLPKIRALIALDGELTRDARRIREGDSILRVGATAATATHFLPAILAAVPDIEVKITQGTPAALYTGLADGQLDLALVAQDAKAACEFIPLWEERLYAVLPASHSVAAPLPLAALDGASLLLPQDEEVEALLSAEGISPRVAARLDGGAILAMAGHGQGVGLLPALSLCGRFAGASCLPTDPPLGRTLGIALSGSKKPSEAARRLIAAARRVAEGFKMEV
jgi:DNA-binding transcriptional LysR family regulator